MIRVPLSSPSLKKIYQGGNSTLTHLWQAEKDRNRTSDKEMEIEVKMDEEITSGKERGLSTNILLKNVCVHVCVRSKAQV